MSRKVQTCQTPKSRNTLDKSCRNPMTRITVLLQTQQRQSTCDVTFRRVRLTIIQLLPLKDNKYCIILVCICSLSYPARKTHAPYCHLWPSRLYNIFPHYLTKHAFRRGGGGRKLLDIKYVF